MMVLSLLMPSPGSMDDAVVNVTPADIAALLVVLRAGVLVLSDDRPVGKVPVSVLIAMGLVVTAGAVATGYATDFALSATGLVRYAEVFVVIPLAVATCLRRRQDAAWVLAAILALGCLEGLLGVHQFVTRTGASYAGQNVRAIGTFGAYNIMSLATVTAYAMLVALAAFLAVRDRRRWFALGAVVALAVPLLLSLSRGAWVALAMGSIAAILMTGPRRLAQVLLGLALAVVAAGMVAPDLAEEQLAQRATSMLSVFSDPDKSVQDRFDLWGTAVKVWREQPVTGVGIKNFPEWRDRHAPLSLSSGSDISDPSNGFRRAPLLSPHNFYLLVLAEQGLLGLMAFCVLFSLLFVLVIRALIQPGLDRRTRWLGLAVSGFLVHYLTASIYGDIGGPTTVLSATWLGLAITASSSSSGDRVDPQRSEQPNVVLAKRLGELSRTTGRGYDA